MDSKDLIIAIAALTIMLVLLGGFILTFIFLFKKRQQVHAAEKGMMQSQFQEELLRTQLEIQEQTFKTISQELHDNIGQMLSLAKLNLNTVDLQKVEKALEKIESAKNLVGKVIHDLRDLSKTLNTDTIAAAGLLNAIEAELQQLEKTGTLQTAFHVCGTHIKLDAQKELILFRIVQEALHNVIKHAQASHVSVSALFEEGQFKLTIADNGRGTAGAGSTAGSGLRNMQSRSRLIGAGWQMESGATGGTTIRITLPTTS